MNYSLLIQAPNAEAAAKHSVTGDISIQVEPASRIELRSESGEQITDAELHQDGNDLHISIATTGTDIILEDYFLGIATGDEVPVGICGDLASLSLDSPLNEGLVESAAYHLLVRAPGTAEDVEEIDINGDTTLPVEASSEVAILNAQGNLVNATISQEGNDLHLLITADGTEIILQGYFTSGAAGQAAHVAAPGVMGSVSDSFAHLISQYHGSNGSLNSLLPAAGLDEFGGASTDGIEGGAASGAAGSGGGGGSGDGFTLMRLSATQYIPFQGSAAPDSGQSPSSGGGGGGANVAPEIAPEVPQAPSLVPPSNSAPTAVDNTFLDAAPDVVTNLTVLNNDRDPDANPLTIVAINGEPVTAGVPVVLPSGATVTLRPDGTIDFQPAANSQSLDEGESATTNFNYTISDGKGGTDSATVTVTVNGANDAPNTAGSIDDQSNNDADSVTFDVSGHFADVDGEALTFSASGLPTGLSIDASTGIISGTIDPSASVSGPYSVTVIASDGDLSTSLTFNWNVANPAPDAVADTYSIGEDESAILGNAITDNDTDPDNDVLTATAQTDVAGSHGGLFSIGSDGQVSFNANGAFEGLDEGESATTSFTYEISDGEGGTDTATVTVTVNGANDAPNTVGSIDDQSNDDADSVTFDVSGHFADVDGEALTFSASGLPTGLSIDASTGVISGTIDPSASVSGPYSVTVIASDGDLSTSLTFNWNVANPAPDAVDDTYSIGEDQSAVIGNAITDNDTDPDSDVLTATAQTDVAGSHGGLFSIGSDGQVSFNANGAFEGLDEGESATTSFTYEISDGEGGTDTATVTVTVNGANDAPNTVGSIDDQSNDDADSVTFDVSGHFADVDGEALTFSASGLPTGLSIDASTGIISGTIDPSASVSGPYSVTVIASDGDLSTSLTFNWNVANPAPDAVADTYSIGEDESAVIGNAITDNDTDPDSDVLTATAQTDVAGSHGGLFSIGSNGQVSFNANGAFEGLDEGESATTSFTYEISDGEGGTDTATVTVTVNGANDAPNTVGLIDDQSNDDADSVSFDVSSHFADVDGEALTFSASGLPAGLSIDASTGVISGTIDPSASVSGPYSVTVIASDGDLSTSLTFNWNVANPAPDAVADTYSIGEDESAVIGNAITDNDTDPDSDVLTATAQTDVAGSHGGLFSIGSDGQVSFNANGAFEGLDEGESATTSFTYEISDGEGGTDTATVTVTVNGANDAPNTVGSIDDQSNDDADSVTFDVSGHFADVDGETLTFSASGLPTGLSIDASTGIISGTIDPSASVSGPYSVTVIASDGDLSTSLTFNWNVANPAPDAVADTYSIGEDESAILGNAITDNDTDPDNDVLTATAQTDVAGSHGGLFSIGSDGQVSFNANGAFEGLDEGESATTSFTYEISDGEGGTDTATVTVTVNGANDAPNTVGSIDDQSNNDADSVSLDVSGHFADVDGEALTFSASGLPTGLSIDASTGIISGTIDPSASVSGPYSVTVIASDGDLSTSLTFNWNVANPAPDAIDDTYSIGEDESAILGNAITDNDTDPDNDVLTATAQTDVAGSHGGLFSIGSDGQVSFNANGAFEGLDEGESATTSFTYEISDGEGGTDTATVTVTVNGANDEPNTVGSIDDQSNNDADSVTFDVSGHFADVDGEALTFSASGLPTGLSIDPGTGIISGTIDPSASVSGPYSVTVIASDGDLSTSLTFNWNVANPAPDAVDDSVSTGEDSALVLGISDIVDPNDTDLDGDTLSITGVSNPTNGSVVLNPDGTVTFTPDAGFHGTATFDYTISDGNGGTDTATVTVNVGSVNDVPDAIDDSVSTDEDTALVLGVSDIVNPNDTDLDGDTLVITGVSNPSNGSVVLNSDGTVTFTPDANFHGTATFDYTISDGNGGTDTATVTVNVGSINDVPIDGDETNTVTEDTTLTVADGATGDLLNNATDIDGGALSISAFSVAGQSGPFTVGTPYSISGVGSLTINANGSYSFAPAASFTGSIPVITYTVSDGNGGTDTSTLTLSMSAVNDAPIDGDETNTVTEDTTLTVADGATGDLLNNATDIDGGALSISAFSVAGQSGPFTVGTAYSISGVGSLTINANGSYSFAPASNFTGSIPVVTYTVSDGNGGTDTSTLTLSMSAVNDAPVDGDETNTVTEDVTLTVADGATGDLLNNATDIDGDALSISGFSVAGQSGPFTVGSAYSISGVGSLTINANGSYSFAPAANFTGSIPVVTYTVSDGNGGTDTSTLTLSMSAVNDAPVDGNETNTVTEDVPLTVADGATGDLLNNATDIDGDALSISGFSVAGQSGPFTVGSAYSISGVGSLTINANGSYSFAPAANFTGSIPVVTYTVSDGNGGTDTSTLTLSMSAVNDAPVDGDETNTVTEDTTLTVADGATGDLLNNATDIDGGALSVSAFSVAGQSGPFTVGTPYSISGVGSLTINANGSYSFAPVANFTGSIPVVTYTVSDGNGGTDTSTLTLSMSAVNDAPVDGDETNTVTEDTTLTVADGATGDLLNNATDADGDSLTISAFSVAGQSGPFAVGTAYAISGVGSLTINANGSYSFAPVANFTGSIPVVTYTVSDGNGGTDASTLTLSMSAVNDAPVDGDETNTVTEDTTLTVADGATGDLLNNATDIDGGALTISAFSVAGQSGPFTVGSAYAISGVGSLTINANGSYSFAPAANFTGSIPVVTYTVSDGNGGTDTSTLTLSMSPVNDAPVDGDETNTVTEDTTLTVADGATGDLLNNATDIDGGALSVSAFSVAGQSGPFTVGTPYSISGVGSLTINANGSYSFAPAANFTGSIPVVTYTVSDGNGGTDTSTLTLSMSPVNDAPVDGNETNTVTEDTTLTVADGATGDLLNNATDIDGGALSVSAFSVAGQSGPFTVGTAYSISGVGSLTINANGSYSFAPASNFTGSIPVVTYTVSDGNGGTDTSTLTLTMSAVNDAPVDGNETNTVTEDTTLTVTDGATGDLLNNATDADGDSLTISAFSVAGQSGPFTVGTAYAISGVGSLTINANGSYSFAPVANFTGSIPVVTYTVSDGNGGTDASTLTLSMSAVNDAPVDGDDTNTVTEDTTLTVADGATGDLLNNATDIDGGALTINAFSVAGQSGPFTVGSAYAISGVGSLTINANGSYSFAPAANFTGSIPVVTYTVSDGNGGTDTSTLTLSMSPVNDAPVDGDETNTVTEDTTLTVADGATGDLLNTATDIDGGALSVSAFSVAGQSGPFTVGTPYSISGVGSLTINANGSYSFAPAANFTGSIPVVTYTVSDGNGGTDTSTLTLSMSPVNDAPVDGNETNTVTEDTTLTVTDGATGDLLNNATDIDGDTLSISAFSVAGQSGPFTVGTPYSISGVGSLTINANGSYSFAPAANFTGSIPVVTYTVSDGNGGTDTSTLTLSMSAVNDAPVDGNETNTVTEDTTLTVTDGATGDLLNNASDIDGGTLSISAFSVAGQSGPFTVGTAYAISGVGSLTINANGSYSFAPASNFTGSIPVVTYTVSDGNGGTDTSTLTLSMSAVNDAPVDGNETNTVTEDTTLTVANGATGDLLNNATDADGDSLTISAFSVAGQSGPFTVGAAYAISGVGSLTINANGSYSFAPVANFTGSIPVVTYTVSDGNGGTDTSTLTLSMSAVNDAPVDGNETNTVTEDTTLTVTDGATGDLLNNASDIDGGTLSISAFSVAGQSGPFTVGTAYAISGVGSLIINANGSYSFAPASNFTGSIPVVTYTVSDGNGGTDTSTLTLTMSAVNDAPVDGNETNTVTEDTTLTVANGATGDLLNNASDIDGDSLSISAFSVAGQSGPFTVGTAYAISGVGSLTINANGSYSFAPAANFTGSIPVVTYTISDGKGGTDTSTLSLSMSAVNDAPTPTNDFFVSGDPMGSPITINVLANDTDIDGTINSASVDLNPSLAGIQTSFTVAGQGVWTSNGSGSVTFTPDAGLVSQPSAISYTITDNSGAVSALASITVRFSAADVWFGNDESGSVSSSDFRQARELISGTADLMDFGTEDVGFNAALFSWADTGSQQMELSLTADKTGFVDDSSSYRRNFSGGTDVGNGLLFGMNQILASVAAREAAGHARAGVPQVLVMMTDATPSQILDDDSLLADAATAKAAGITIVFVAIQEAQEDPDALAILQQAASLDANGDPLVVTAASYDSISAADMATLLQTIREAAAASLMPPVVIDLDHDGAEFVALSNGIDFDTDGDGQVEHTAWAHSDDAVLVYDRDSNGLVDGRAEVAFKDYDPDAETDLEGLRAFDTDQDGFLDADDDQFDLFKAWQDADGDGVVDEGEMLSLTELGIESIALTSDGNGYTAAEGDIIVHGTTDVHWADGTIGEAADASFAYVEKPGPVNSTIEPDFDPEPIEIMTDSGEVINLDEPIVCVGLPEIAVCEMAPPCEEEAPVPAPQAAPDDEAAAAAAAMAA